MWHSLMRVFSNWSARRFRNVLGHAIELPGRGGARDDALRLGLVHSHLEVEWMARDVHPWDAEAKPEERARLFVKQVISDVDAAVERLFAISPELDSLHVRVLDPHSGSSIMTGVVERSCLAAPRPQSNQMRLAQLGLGFRLHGNHFEPLQAVSTKLQKTA